MKSREDKAIDIKDIRCYETFIVNVDHVLKFTRNQRKQTENENSESKLKK